jgi:hypothetical protein
MSLAKGKINQIEKLLKKYRIPIDKICLIKGMSLEANDIRSANDIDLCVHKDYLKNFDNFSGWKNVNESMRYKVYSKNGIDIDIDYYLAILGISDNEIIDNPSYFFYNNGFKVLRLEIVFASKNIRGKPHDLKDLHLIYGYHKKNKNFTWNWSLVKDGAGGLRKPTLNLSKPIKKRIWQITEFYVNPRLLFSLQYKANEFNAIDTIVRWLAIRDYVNGKTLGVRLYIKMQKLRGNYDTWESFKALINSFNAIGFNKSFPVEIDQEGTLIDGSHRLACSLYFNLNLIHVVATQKKFRRDYRISWFKEVGFSRFEINAILKAKNTIFQKLGLNFPVIIWPPAINISDDIKNIISRNYAITYDKTFDLNSKLFKKVATKICRTDGIDDWKLERKLEAMDLQFNKIRILGATLENGSWRKKEKNMVLSVNFERIKREIRLKYYKKINHYIQDIIVHIPDNPDHVLLINEIIKNSLDASYD